MTFLKFTFAYSKTSIYFAMGVLASIATLVAFAAHPGIMKWADNKIYDAFMRLNHSSEISRVPLIVDIDEKSLAIHGQWPWPRYLTAVMLRNLENAGAMAIGIDVLLSERDRTSPKILAEDFKKYFGASVDIQGLPPALADNDEYLASVLKKAPAVLGFYANFGEPVPSINAAPPFLKTAVLTKKGASAENRDLMKASGVTSPLEEFSSSAPCGFINAVMDDDGIIRRVPLIIEAENDKSEKGFYAHLSVATLARALGARTWVVTKGEDGPESIRVGSYTIPLESDGTFAVSYNGGRGFYEYISASDIISGDYDRSDVSDRIVFIGSSAPGLLDIRATPFDSYYPGVEVHASIVDSILSGKFLSVPSWTPGLQILLILFFGLVTSLIFGRLPPYLSIPFLVMAVTAVWLAAYGYYISGFFVSPLYVSVVMTISAFSVMAARFLNEFYERRTLKNAFGRYVSPEVVARIADKGVEVLKGEEREVTALFCDIRGFTSLAEKLSPEQVVKLLNGYFTPMTHIIRSSEGTLDKFIGDAIMAFWNAPLDVENHPAKAVGAALAMRKKLGEIRENVKRSYDVHLDMGVGIHTGNVYVGNMGSEELLNYTIIGDNVNLSSRLEGLCSKYGVSIAISGETVSECGDNFVFQRIDRLRVKGKKKPVEAYFAISREAAEPKKEELTFYEEGLTLYDGGDFSGAEKVFESLEKFYPESESARLYAFYRQRCVYLMENRRPDWNGIWSWETK